MMDGEMDEEWIKYCIPKQGEFWGAKNIISLSVYVQGEGRNGKMTTSHSCPCGFPMSDDGGEQRST